MTNFDPSILLPLLTSQIPEYTDIAGKHYPIRKVLQGAVFEFLAAAPSSTSQVPPQPIQPLPPIVFPPSPPPIIPPQPSHPLPPVVSPPSLLEPDAIGFDVTLIELGGSGKDIRSFEVNDVGDHYELVLGSDSPTTNLPLHSRIDLAAIYFKDGKKFRFEDQTPPALHLYYTAQWFVTDDVNITSIGPGKDSEMIDTGSHVANFARYSQTGGMNPTLKIPESANNKILKVGLHYKNLTDKLLWLPLAS